MTTPSTDVMIPTVLLRRYDSLSTSSGSTRSSMSSTSSSTSPFNSSSNRCQRPGQRRTARTKLEREDSAVSSIQSGNAMNTEFETQQTDETDEHCFLCNTMVNERQYYLWQSNFTKSSFCSRCIEDNNALNYVSYWGTSCYKSGSWRERYSEGRSFDIDVTPLLEVLDRIERIDTSICGYKSTTMCPRTDVKPAENTTTSTHAETCTKIEEIKGCDYNLTERRQRRLRNRESLTSSCTESINTFNHKLNQSKKDNDSSRHNAVNRLKSSTTHVSYIANESCQPQQLDHVEVIEPLVIERAKEKQYEMSAQQRPSKYVGKTLYDQFVDGLSLDSKLTRRSTTTFDLSNLGKAKHSDTENCQNSDNVDNNDGVDLDQLNDATMKHENAHIKLDIVCPEVRRCTELPTEHSTKQYEQDNDAEFVNKGKVGTKDQRNTGTRRTHSIDRVLAYKRKNGETDGNGRVKRYHRHKKETQPIKNLNKDDENISEDELTFIEKRHMFEIMQSDGYTCDKQTINISQGKCRSRYPDGTTNSNRDGAKENVSHVREPIIHHHETDTTEVYDNKEVNNTDSKFAKTKSTCIDYKNNPDGINALESINSKTVKPNLPHENEQQCIKSTESNLQEHVLSEKTQLVHQEDDTLESESSNGDPDVDDDNTSSWNNDDGLDLSSPISNTEDTTLSRSVSGEADNSEIRRHSDEMNEKQHRLMNRIRSKYRLRTIQKSDEVQHTENKADNVMPDVPHIERIKKKLGRSQNDDETLEEDTSYMEIDVCDNDQMELSWRSRGYNADFFMSRQSVTGSEIIDRYNRAISKRRRRKRPKSSSFSCGQSGDLDTLTEHGSIEPISRPKSHSLSTPASRQKFTRSDTISINSNESKTDSKSKQHPVRPKSHAFTRAASVKSNASESDSMSDTNDRVSPLKLTEALTRAKRCSKRFAQRLRSQLNECSEDSSSS